MRTTCGLPVRAVGWVELNSPPPVVAGCVMVVVNPNNDGRLVVDVVSNPLVPIPEPRSCIPPVVVGCEPKRPPVVVAGCVVPVVVIEPNRPPPLVAPNVDPPNTPPACSVVEPSLAPNGLAVAVVVS